MASAHVNPHVAGNVYGSNRSEPTTTYPAAQYAASSTAALAGSIRIFDASAATSDGRAGFVGTAATLSGAAGSSDAATAAAYVSRGLNYFQQTFGRNGIDAHGGTIDVVLNDHSTDASGRELFRGNGGYYTTRDSAGNLSEAVRWGTGITYNHRNGGVVDQRSMLYADDLTVHELTHGLIKRETGEIGGTADEAGSVNEAFADVMGAAATRDWRMGEGMYTSDSSYRYMRNIAQPNDPLAVHGLWTTIGAYNDAAAQGRAEEHYGSGVISHAAAVMQQTLGGERGWQAVEQTFYRTIDSHRMGDMSFAAAAAGLRTSVAELYGSSSQEASALDTALRQAGI